MMGAGRRTGGMPLCVRPQRLCGDKSDLPVTNRTPFLTSQKLAMPLQCVARTGQRNEMAGRPKAHGKAASTMQETSTKKIYDVRSMFYDATFGRLVKRRIERAIN